MFFDGYPTSGVCPGGGGHHANGYTFVVPHDVCETDQQQANWRFCDRCYGMFFNGPAQSAAEASRRDSDARDAREGVPPHPRGADPADDGRLPQLVRLMIACYVAQPCTFARGGQVMG